MEKDVLGLVMNENVLSPLRDGHPNSGNVHIAVLSPEVITQRRKKHESLGILVRWTTTEKELLIKLWKLSKTRCEIRQALNKSRGAVNGQIDRLLASGEIRKRAIRATEVRKRLMGY